MLLLIIGLVAFALVHLCAIFALATAFKLPVLQLSLGVGPTVFGTSRIRLRLFPVSGFVQFEGVVDVSAGFPRTVLEDAPLYQRFLLALVGPVSVLLLSWLCISGQAFTEFLELPQQLVAGALSPFSGAQGILSSADSFLKRSPALFIFGVVAAKHSALNLLPFPGFNGGVLLALFGRATGLHRFWPAAATGSLLVALLLLFALWAAALALYLWRAFT